MAVLSIRNLRKNYGDFQAVRGVSFDVEGGQIIGYIGPNGAGKSTTIKIITGILGSFEGEVEVLGMDIRKSPEEIKRRVGYVPEVALLYESLTAEEYLQFVGQLYGMEKDMLHERIYALLELFGLLSEASQRMTGFSKGMKQKVLFISALLHNPDILILDEPLSGLDANAVILVKELLLQMKMQGKTIFYSSHIMDVVEKLSDRIILLDKGLVLADGTMETLRAQSQSGSLERIFSELTRQQGHAQTAAAIMQVINR